MKKVFKYIIKSQDCILNLPKEAKILTVKLQNGVPTLWALVNQDNIEESRNICIVGTGWDVEDNMEYISTYIDGYFVWHVFEILKK